MSDETKNKASAEELKALVDSDFFLHMWMNYLNDTQRTRLITHLKLDGFEEFMKEYRRYEDRYKEHREAIKQAYLRVLKTATRERKQEHD